MYIYITSSASLVQYIMYSEMLFCTLWFQTVVTFLFCLSVYFDLWPFTSDIYKAHDCRSQSKWFLFPSSLSHPFQWLRCGKILSRSAVCETRWRAATTRFTAFKATQILVLAHSLNCTSTLLHKLSGWHVIGWSYIISWRKKVSLHSLFIRRSRAKRIIQSGFSLIF